MNSFSKRNPGEDTTSSNSKEQISGEVNIVFNEFYRDISEANACFHAYIYGSNSQPNSANQHSQPTNITTQPEADQEIAA
ncbi:MAG TPA: hypothetical protein VMR18_03225 [Candidatus Saccharimonadales bacterium]|jgi:hypothetical protein|nr:hypothetical protein [Candidatus Saccharimonadales bacterium]